MQRPGIVIAVFGLVGCPGGVGASAFEVAVTFPADGQDAFPETPVRVGFSQAPDMGACADAIGLVALADDARVAWRVPFELVEDPDGNPHTWELVHEEPLTVGVEHAITVGSGPGACVSEAGLPLEGRVSRFWVIERTGG